MNGSRANRTGSVARLLETQSHKCQLKPQKRKYFPRSRLCPRGASSRNETAARRGSIGRVCACDTVPDGEQGARSRARERAPFSDPSLERRAAAGICRTGNHTSKCLFDRRPSTAVSAWGRTRVSRETSAAREVWKELRSSACARLRRRRRARPRMSRLAARGLQPVIGRLRTATLIILFSCMSKQSSSSCRFPRPFGDF